MKHRKGYTFRRRPCPRSAPAHLREDERASKTDPKRWPSRWSRLYKEGNGLAGLYGAPVYLVGSALNDANAEPRDWDVRITLSDRSFAARYGSVEQWIREGETGNWTSVRWCWSADCVKQAKHMAGNTRLNIDFQVYPQSYVAKRFDQQPRLRLDTRHRRPLRNGNGAR